MPFIAVSTVLLIIFVGYSLSRFLHQADAGLLNTGEVAFLTLLKVLIALEVLLPIGLFFGVMLGLGKLHNDSEIIAMHASGISESRMVRPIVALAVPLALVIACLSIYIRPWAYTQTYQMLAIAEASSDIDRIKPGQFYLTRKSATVEEPGLDNETEKDEDRAIFIENISPEQVLDHVFIRTRIGDELQIIAARSGLLVEQPGSDYQLLELEKARIYKRVDDGPNLFAQIEHFTMKVEDKQPEPPAYKAKSIASTTLATSTNPKDQAEYQWRISNPVTTLLLALLAIPLSRSRPRHGRYAKLLLAFVIYAGYYNLIGISRTWVEQQAAATIWWAPSLLALIVALFYLPWHSLTRKLAALKNDNS
jgi:lipopolysaccharide export system permease protein